MPVLAWPIRYKAGNQTVRGSYCFAEAFGLGGLQDGACNDRGLMAAGAALIALKAPSVDNVVVMASATRTTKTSRRSSPLQSCHTKLFCPVQTLKIQQGKPFLKLNAVSRHDHSDPSVPKPWPGIVLADKTG
jgi:hypothetical protein